MFEFFSLRSQDGKYKFKTKLETKVKALLSPFQEYIASQVMASIVLFFCTILALVWASIPSLAVWYERFVHLSIGFHVSSFSMSASLHFWVNDVLLTLFFFILGLEIKREFLVGELVQRKKAVFIVFGAVGGMVFPAVIYYLFNMGTSAEVGWGIPIATDTAFSLGVLSCFKRRLPEGVFTFLAALAIIDDIGAIAVIAIFYTSHLNVNMLLISGSLLLVLAIFNCCGARRPAPYIVVGFFMWLAVESAGIHGTVAGILVAFMIPARPEFGARHYMKRVTALLRGFERRRKSRVVVLEDEKMHATLEKVEAVTRQSTTPLQRWEGKLQVPVAMIVLPLFCLLNAGIAIHWSLIKQALTHAVSLGIIFGLVVGKPLGVILFGALSLWLRIGVLPEGALFRHIVGVALLTGIGFTMSLLISGLSFSTGSTLFLTKIAILLASFFSMLMGAVFIWYVSNG